MDESLFYIAGGALIVIAIVVSLAGMRSEKFPSDGLLKIGIPLIAVLVAITAYGAVKLSQSEQADRLDESNLEADVAAADQNVENQDIGNTEDPTPANGGAGPKDAVDQNQETSGVGQLDGAAVFVETGCGSCHSLAELGADAQGTIGPNLDEALLDKDATFIQESIEDPSSFVEAGFPDGTMPQTYKVDLTPAQIDALVAYLSQSTSSKN